MSGLPRGWALLSIDETGEYINGFAFKPAHWQATGTPIVRIQNLTDESKPLNRTKTKVPEQYSVERGDMLVSWSATLDVFYWRREPAVLNQHIFKVVPNEQVIEKELLFHWLKRAIEELQETEHLHGSTMKHINRGPFLAHELPLPPRAEQTRIVEKLESLLADLDAGVAELKAAQRKLVQYRQSLLKAAVDGTLTADWRAVHTPEESGERLLQRILQERRARFVQKHGSKKKYKEPVAPDVSQLPELPDGWVWATLDQTVAESLVGLDRGQEHQTSTGAYGYIKMNNVSMSGEVDTSNLVRVDAGDEEFIRYEVRVNDLLFNTRNSKDLVGKVGLVHTLNSRTTYNNNLMRLRFDGVLLPEFACYQMCGPEFRSRMEKIKRATTSVAAVYAKDLFPLAIAVPPIAEQHAILAQFDTVLAACKQQEQAIAHGLKLAAAQRRNLLRAAFAGQLVPQDPNDEPASELLARIRAERAGSTGKTGSRTRRPGQLTSTNT